MWIANTRIGLPKMEEREVWAGIKVLVPTGETEYKERGDQITSSELKDLGWSPEKIKDDIAELSKHGSLVSPDQYSAIVAEEEADVEALAARRAEIETEVTRRVLKELAAAKTEGSEG